MLSLVEVNIIGDAAVPIALILEPLAIIKAEANEPVPGEPFIIVPSSMVNVTQHHHTHVLALLPSSILPSNFLF